MTDREFALFLALTPGVGGRTLRKILTRIDLLSIRKQEFLTLSPEALREEFGLQSAVAERIASTKSDGVHDIRIMQERLNRLGVTLVTQMDAQYPHFIEEVDGDAPWALFLYGNHKLLGARTFCVLSSRNTAPAGRRKIEELTEQGVLEGEVLVSSDNKPEYQQSAVVPLRWGAPRILCLDRGLFECLGPELKDEPFRTARLWRYQFDPITDLAVSPFRPEAKYSGVNNQVRDRLVVSLSRRSVFVQVNPGGQMEKLVGRALRANQPVKVSDLSPNYRRFAEAGAEIIPG